MGFFGDLVSGGAKGVLEGAGSFAVKIREAFTGEAVLTADQKAELLAQAEALEGAAQAAAASFDQAQMQGQVDLLKIDQSSTSFFKSGWRPAAGWIAVFGFSYTVAIRPLAPWIIQVGAYVFGFDPTAVPLLPPIETSELVGLLTGMLGLGGMRTFEKVRSAANAK